MTPATGTLIPLVIISIGFIGIILSFLVPDRKKYVVSLILSGLIIGAGIFGLGSQSISRYQWNKRLRELQKDRQVDLEELRQRLKDKASETNPGSNATKPK